MFKDKIKRRGLEGRFSAASCAISDDTIYKGQGSPVFSASAAILREHGIDCFEKRSAKLVREDYERFDLFVIMDEENKREALRIFGGDPAGKIKFLAEYAGGGVIDDPWYSRDFQRAYREIETGVEGLLDAMTKGEKQ